MQLHLKTGDGDLALIKEPALLTRCACISHEIYRPSLTGYCILINARLIDWSGHLIGSYLGLIQDYHVLCLINSFFCSELFFGI